MGARCSRQALDLYQAQLTGRDIEAGHVVAEVLLMYIVDLAALFLLVLHHHLHGGHLGLGVRAQALHFWTSRARGEADECAGESFNALKGESPLLLEFASPSFAPRHGLVVAGFGLGQTSFGTGYLLVQSPRTRGQSLGRFAEAPRSSDKLDVLGYPVHFFQPLVAHLFN